MNEEQLKTIEENIAEVISGNILLASDGPRIAAMVMERLEVKGLLGGEASGSRTEKFTDNNVEWRVEELRECTIMRGHDEFVFTHPSAGKEIGVADVWLSTNIGCGLVEMRELIEKSQFAGTIT